MEIVPHGKIYLLENVPLNNTYENTILFANKTAQENYFITKCPNLSTLSFNDMNYQRVNAGVLRIKGVPERIMRCNYMMFRNEFDVTDSENQSNNGTATFDWVYAFITDVTYISTFCAEIHYEIDVMQTFHVHYVQGDGFNNYVLGQCMVEREHSVLDIVGYNLVDEGLPCGDYNYTELEEYNENGNIPAFSRLAETVIIVAATFDINYNSTYGASVGGTYSSFKYFSFINDVNGRILCSNFINGAAAANKETEIVAVFLMPKIFADNITVTEIPFLSSLIPISNLVSGDFDGYTPKNNKLYTYPYNSVMINNMVGNTAEYRIEKFTPTTPAGNHIQFDYFLDFSCSPIIQMYPKNYDKISANYNEGISLGPYPQCSWVGDSFKAWVAQNSDAFLISSIGSSVSMLSSALLGIGAANITGTEFGTGPEYLKGDYIQDTNIVNTATSGITGALNAISTIVTASKMPDHHYGNVDSPQGWCSKKQFYFHAYNKRLRGDYAQMIDNYFTMYGYKLNMVKTPNVNARPHFTYTKTINCYIAQNIGVPSVYLNKIISIYNNGVRFWKNPSEIGNYSVNNAPV